MGQDGRTNRSEPVPVDILRYAVYNIMFPKFDVDLTRTLLDLLASVELHRQIHMEIIEDCLPSTRTNADEEPSDLDPDLAAYMRSIVKNDPPSRNVPGNSSNELCKSQ